MIYLRLAVVFLAVHTLALPAAPTLAFDNPLARPSDAPKPFAGDFLGDNVKLSLAYDAAANAYRGEVAIAEAKYPCTATESNGSLAGTFAVDGQSYAFTATLTGDQLNLVSDGATHRLTKARLSPKNPLAGGGGPPNPLPPQPQPQPAPMPRPAATGPTGGVGISFEPTEDGLVIRALMPGGAAEKAKLRLGGVLVAVDGKDIDGMSPEQLRGLLSGEPGTLVKLTIEYDNEVTDAILQRTLLTQQPPTQPPQDQPPQPQEPQQQPQRQLIPEPPRGNDPRMAPADGRPMVNGLGILKPGLRVTYFMGSASLPAVRSVLVQDDQGNWIDPGTGQHFAQADNPSTGGAGYNQLTIVAANDKEIAADDRNYVLMDPQQGLAVTSNYAAYVGTPDNFGDFWQPPAKLAQMRDSNEGGLQIRHMQYPVSGKTFNAITITNTSGTTFSRNVYDTETGILIAQSSSTTGAGQVTPNANGTASPAAGVTTITSTRLLDVHQLDLPWANQGLPAWATPNASLEFSGTYANLIQGAPAMQPWQLQSRFVFGDGHGNWMPCKQFIRLNTGFGNPPQDSEIARALGTSLTDPLWIDPQILGQIRPNSVIDDDKITKRRTTYLGVQGGFAMFTEQAPYEERHYGYDTRTGTLTTVENHQQQGPATLIQKLQLANQP